MEFSDIGTLLAGPGGAMVLLGFVLYLTYRLVNRMISSMTQHLERIEDKFDKLNSNLELVVSLALDKEQKIRKIGEAKSWQAE